MNEYEISELLPLHPLAPVPGGQGQEWPVTQLRTSPSLPADLRRSVAEYLENCPVFFAWMGYTDDLIGGKFTVAGGSAIYSDGVYYWRLDGAEYVRHYGVEISDDALEHFKEMNWQPPEFSRDEFLAIYRKLDELIDAGREVG
jgi:hypothetical protein